MEFINEVFQEIKKRRKTQHLYTEQDYYNLIDEVLIEKRDTGELPPDFDEKQAREDLEERWKEIEAEPGNT